ncbi:hypothetical protein JTE90_008282 [Oedothorax gibbosus]|uniref:Uncharacterized protein n=1 Tax=Oedothorax gibbosus TaxID=931172 RepID=A0AAV6UIN1_9ARAC|nr:hypothetical protein JTE90_008282 [Oedothorax gibbosus]
METNNSLRVQCCNPLKKSFYKKQKKTEKAWMPEMFSQIARGSMICDKCRKEVTYLKNTPSISEINEEVSEASCSKKFCDNDPDFTASAVVQTINTSLQELGESPIDKRKLKYKKYSKSKVKKISSSMKRKLFVAIENSSSENDNEDSVLQNLKSNFLSSTSRSKKLMLLTCLPANWSIRKIMREFNAPNYMVRQSKKILKEKGILEGPNSKPRKSLQIETVEILQLKNFTKAMKLAG